jgi:hypothetical protein
MRSDQQRSCSAELLSAVQNSERRRLSQDLNHGHVMIRHTSRWRCIHTHGQPLLLGTSTESSRRYLPTNSRAVQLGWVVANDWPHSWPCPPKRRRRILPALHIDININKLCTKPWLCPIAPNIIPKTLTIRHETLLLKRGHTSRHFRLCASRNLCFHLRNVTSRNLCFHLHNTWSALRCQQGIIQRTP